MPRDILGGFLETVAAALRPRGKLFFVDGCREASSTACDHRLPAEGEQVTTRLLNDGRSFRIVKNFHDPGELAARCAAAGLKVRVRETATYFVYGVGERRG